MMKAKTFILIFAAWSLGGCRNADSPKAAENESAGESWFEARYPADLGPGLVDVSSYPKEQQENYRLFLAVCSSCHTTARPLNMPYQSDYDWKRYVHRMHVKIGNMGFDLPPELEKRIVDFLVYDSKVRKGDHAKEFKMQTEIMEALFDDIVAERERLLTEETRNMPKRETPYVGVK